MLRHQHTTALLVEAKNSWKILNLYHLVVLSTGGFALELEVVQNRSKPAEVQEQFSAVSVQNTASTENFNELHGVA